MTNLQPLPMSRMVEHVARELEMTSTVFSVSPGYRGMGVGARLPFGRLDLPLGTAPGPHGLLAQNLVCAYVAGARFLSLAPLGEALPALSVGSDGVCRRRERSGGALSARQAAAEAVKASILIQLLCRELGLGDPGGMALVMCLDAGRAFLAREDVQTYLDTLQNAAQTEVWRDCLSAAKKAVGRFNSVEREDLDELDPCVSKTARVTLPEDGDLGGVELLLHRGLHVILVVNRFEKVVDKLPALRALAETAAEAGASLSLEVSGSRTEEGETLSGPFLAPETLRLAARLGEAAPGLPLHYAGGADQLNLARLAGQGFQTVSVCTTLLKPGGYLRLRQMARTLAALRAPGACGEGEEGRVDPESLRALADALDQEVHYQRRDVSPRPRAAGKPPVTDCFIAPCQGGCPFGEDIPGALRRKGAEAAGAIDLDSQLLDVMEVDVRLGAAPPPPATLLKTGYSHVVDAREAPQAQGGGSDQLFLDETELTDEGAGSRIFVLGDGAEDLPGAIAAAHRVVDGLLGPAKPYPHPAGRRGGAMGKKGKVWLPGEAAEECHRCLECATVCECCVDVCPNRANVPITVLTKRNPQIVHLDALCSACGLCASFCPYDGAPYRDKFTLFETTEAFTKSGNDGFVVLDFLSRKVRLRLEGRVRDASLRIVDLSIPGEIQELMETIFTDYPYLLDPDRRKGDDQVSLWT